MNIGVGEEITIRDLADMISKVVGFKGNWFLIPANLMGRQESLWILAGSTVWAGGLVRLWSTVSLPLMLSLSATLIPVLMSRGIHRVQPNERSGYSKLQRAVLGNRWFGRKDDPSTRNSSNISAHPGAC